MIYQYVDVFCTGDFAHINELIVNQKK